MIVGSLEVTAQFSVEENIYIPYHIVEYCAIIAAGCLMTLYRYRVSVLKMAAAKQNVGVRLLVCGAYYLIE